MGAPAHRDIGRLPDIVLHEGPRHSARMVSAGLRFGTEARRLVLIWLPNADGHRPVFGSYEKLRSDPDWRDLLPFHECFHGETGAGLGASHQTGWTGLVAHLLARGAALDD
jgi:hypothetical protein